MTYEADQMGFVEIMQAAEEAERDRADAHRARTQQFFDALTEKQRDRAFVAVFRIGVVDLPGIIGGRGRLATAKELSTNYCGAGGCVPASAGVTWGDAIASPFFVVVSWIAWCQSRGRSRSWSRPICAEPRD